MDGVVKALLTVCLLIHLQSSIVQRIGAVTIPSQRFIMQSCSCLRADVYWLCWRTERSHKFKTQSAAEHNSGFCIQTERERIPPLWPFGFVSHLLKKDMFQDEGETVSWHTSPADSGGRPLL